MELSKRPLHKSYPENLEFTKMFFEGISFYKCSNHTWDKVFKSGQSKICRRQPLKNLKGYGPSYFLKAVFHKFYLVHS